MKLKYSEILVVDLEATCQQSNIWPEGQYQEIIEIGVCRLKTKSLTIEDKTSILVKPECSKINKYCTDLTGITPEDVLSACSFKEASIYLQEEFDSLRAPWASYGDWDKEMLDRQCSQLNIQNPFSKRHLNIKLLFPIVFNLNREYGLKKAISKIKKEFVGNHHRGDDDAYNAAIILKECLRGGYPIN